MGSLGARVFSMRWYHLCFDVAVTRHDCWGSSSRQADVSKQEGSRSLCCCLADGVSFFTTYWPTVEDQVLVEPEMLLPLPILFSLLVALVSLE